LPPNIAESKSSSDLKFQIKLKTIKLKRPNKPEAGLRFTPDDFGIALALAEESEADNADEKELSCDAAAVLADSLCQSLAHSEKTSLPLDKED